MYLISYLLREHICIYCSGNVHILYEVHSHSMELQEAKTQSGYVAPYPCNHVCIAFILPVHGEAGKHLFDLNKVTYVTKGRYGKDVFPCCTIRSDEPKVTLEIFETGKVVVSGAAHEEGAHLALWQLAHTLGRIFDTSFYVSGFKVVNIVMSGSLGFSIDPKQLDAAFKPRKVYLPDNKEPRLDVSSWVPQKFGGVRIFIGMRKPVIIMFSTGRYVLTGSKSQQQHIEELERIDWREFAAPEHKGATHVDSTKKKTKGTKRKGRESDDNDSIGSGKRMKKS